MDFLQSRAPRGQRVSGNEAVSAVKKEEEDLDLGDSSVQTDTYTVKEEEEEAAESSEIKQEPEEPSVGVKEEERAAGVKEEESPVEIGSSADSPAEVEVDLEELGSDSEESSEKRPGSRRKGRKRPAPAQHQPQRKVTRIQWKEKDMVRALKEVSAGLSVRRAADLFNIPRSTLGDRIRGRVTHGCRTGPKQLLTSEDEGTLVQYCIYCTKHGFPLTKAQLLAYADSVRRKRNPAKPPPPPLGKKWWQCFRRRHATELNLRMSDNPVRRRLKCPKQMTVNQYFDLLSSTLKQYGLTNQPTRIYNCNGTGFEVDGTEVKVLPNHQAPDTQDLVSVLACFNAAGEDIPPFFAFTKRFPGGPYYQDEHPNAIYGKSQTGYIDGHLFQRWFDHFIHHARRERPLLLIFDGHKSNLTPGVFKMARRENVVLLCLPPRSSDVLQPLGLEFFDPLKAELANVAGNKCHLSDSYFVDIDEFPKVFGHPYQQLKDQGTVLDGFRKCGIFPLNRHAVNSSRLVHSARPSRTRYPESPSSSSSVESYAVPSTRSNHPPVAAGLIQAELRVVLTRVDYKKEEYD